MNSEVGPALMKALVGCGSRDVERVLVDGIDLRERFDQIEGVAFVTSELRPDSMSINRDPHLASRIFSHKKAQKAQSEKVLPCLLCFFVADLFLGG